ncbi:hypothetical protein COV16_03895 [Candidatus Woesearchaeota archaeon CG10_big_fil_rev_8_21_14_0_10_34_8]|nr:MAG: hypothetical protein COV16_03895 [Candidatus Woesearchaeota archaeon CG10_big_fil_rev_8_21_14_0_10_34_8]
MDIKLVLFDIEGTLTLGPDGTGHDPELYSCLKKLTAKGIKVGLVSGREASYMKGIYRFFELNGPIIAENGCLLIPDLNRNETDVKNYGGFTEEKKRQIREKLNGYDFSPLFEDTGKQSMFTLVNYDLNILVRKHKEIKELLADESNIEVTHSAGAVDITPKGVNKGTTITRYCREFNFPLSSVCYVGDSLNDMAAFEVVGEGGGFLGVVSDFPVLRKKLEDYPVYYTKNSASNGAVEFIKYILKK